MRTATARMAIGAAATTTPVVPHALWPRLIGLAIASLLPAIFWAGVLYLVSHGLGEPLTSKAIEMTGGAIALFLLAVCAPMMLRGENSQQAPSPAYVRGRRPSRASSAISLDHKLQAHVFKRDA